MQKKILLVSAAALGIVGLRLSVSRPKKRRKQPPRFGTRYFAHRGLWGDDVPENSLAAIVLASVHGYGAELDINLDRDGNVVVFHDDDLQRMTGYAGRLNDTPAAVWKKLRLQNTQQGIPLFSKVLAAADGMPLIVELKTTPRYRELCEKTLALLGGYAGDYAVESFDPRIVGWFARHAPHILRGQLVSRAKGQNAVEWIQRFALEKMPANVITQPHFIACEKELLATRAIRAWQKRGTAIVVWTTRSERETANAADADAVIFEGYMPR